MTSRPAIIAVSHTNVLGGAERIMARTLGLARADGGDVACVAPPGPFAELLAREGVRHIEGPDLRRYGAGPTGLVDLSRRWAVGARLLRRLLEPADVVVANGLRSLPIIRLARPRAPVAWWVHDVVAPGTLWQLCRLCAPAVDLAIPVSESAGRLPRALGLPTVVVRHGTPWPVEVGPDIAERRPVVGCAAVLSPWKGQATLLEAVAGMQRSDVRVELIGSPPPKDADYPDQLRTLARRLGIADRVDLLGQVSDGPAKMRSWAVLAVPSTDPEAWPLVVLEAMSVGTPVVASDHGGPGELLAGIGELVPPGDAAALGSSLDRVLGDADLWRRHRDAGLAAVERDLVFEDQARRFVAEVTLTRRRARGRPVSPGRPGRSSRLRRPWR